MEDTRRLDKPVKDLIIEKVIGKMHWHGDTNQDRVSLENMEAAYELALVLIDSIYDNATLPPNAVATSSGRQLNKRAKDMLSYIGDICSEVNND